MYKIVKKNFAFTLAEIITVLAIFLSLFSSTRTAGEELSLSFSERKATVSKLASVSEEQPAKAA